MFLSCERKEKGVLISLRSALRDKEKAGITNSTKINSLTDPEQEVTRIRRLRVKPSSDGRKK